MVRHPGSTAGGIRRGVKMSEADAIVDNAVARVTVLPICLSCDHVSDCVYMPRIVTMVTYSRHLVGPDGDGITNYPDYWFAGSRHRKNKASQDLEIDITYSGNPLTPFQAPGTDSNLSILITELRYVLTSKTGPCIIG